MPLLLLLFLVLPIAELYVIIKVGGAIGIVPTLALLIVDGFVGAALARSQGRAAWERFNRALAEGRIPARETYDGAMIILGGALLLTPGFITDIFGFFFVLPFTRPLARKVLAAFLSRRIAAQLGGNPITGFMPGTFRPPTAEDAERAHRQRQAGDDVVQGEVIDPDKPQDK